MVQDVAPNSAATLLNGLHFTTACGQRFVELCSLFGRLGSGKRKDKGLKAVWRQMGQDAAAPEVEGVRALKFPAVRGCARGSEKYAANLQGFQHVLRELEPEALKKHERLLAAVARELGGEVRLESRHLRMELCDGIAVSLVMDKPPRMVLSALLEAFGVEAPQNYIERSLMPYFGRLGVAPMESADDAAR